MYLKRMLGLLQNVMPVDWHLMHDCLTWGIGWFAAALVVVVVVAVVAAVGNSYFEGWRGFE